MARATSEWPAPARSWISTDLNRTLLGTLLVGSAAALFGTLSYVTRNADALGMGALPFITWRGALATLALLPIVWLASSRAARPTGIAQLAPNRRWALLAACLIGATLNIAMFQAFLLTTIAVVLICFYTFPAIVTIAAVPLYGERIDPLRAGALVLSGIGLVTVVLAPVLTSSDVKIDPTGIGLAFGAAICQATFILIVGRGFDPLPAPKVSLFAIFAAGAMGLVLAILFGDTAGLLVPFQDRSDMAVDHRRRDHRRGHPHHRVHCRHRHHRAEPGRDHDDHRAACRRRARGTAPRRASVAHPARGRRRRAHGRGDSAGGATDRSGAGRA